jgi:hypothetical protein
MLGMLYNRIPSTVLQAGLTLVFPLNPGAADSHRCRAGLQDAHIAIYCIHSQIL